MDRIPELLGEIERLRAVYRGRVSSTPGRLIGVQEVAFEKRLSRPLTLLRAGHGCAMKEGEDSAWQASGPTGSPGSTWSGDAA